MKKLSLSELFRADWDHRITWAAVEHGLSSGAVRALKAHAEVEVVETLATVEDAGGVSPRYGADVLKAWRQWHPAYVTRSIEQMVPELKERWPTKKEKAIDVAKRQKIARWCGDAEQIVAVMWPDDRWWLETYVFGKINLRPGRFDRLVSVLVREGALSRRDRGSHVGAELRANATPAWAREKMHTLCSYI